MDSNIPVAISELLEDLHYVAGLPNGSKLNIRYKHYSNYTIIDSLRRTFWGENRDATIKWLNELIDRSISLSIKYPEWKTEILKRVKSLDNTMNILKGSYNNDPAMLSKIEVFELRIKTDNFLSSIYKATSTPIEIKNNYSAGENGGGSGNSNRSLSFKSVIANNLPSIPRDSVAEHNITSLYEKKIDNDDDDDDDI